MERLKQCQICPHKCKVNRLEGNIGRCKANSNIKIGLTSLHFFEEPCISGTNGSGTIFFSNCNLNCIYCQNYEISQECKGKEITINELADKFIELQNKKAHNINLVTPTIYTYQIIEAIKIAKKNGLQIPIIYNTNGYETEETLRLLEGYIDVYLPDFKYFDNDLAKKYSNIDNYPEIAKKAIKEMYRQVGAPVLDEKGIIKKGLIIRHLILPNHINNSKQVLKWISSNIDNNAYVSIMMQYFPTYLAQKDDLLNRKLTKEEYLKIQEYVDELDIKNGYMQELGEHEEEYVPKFDI